MANSGSSTIRIARDKTTSAPAKQVRNASDGRFVEKPVTKTGRLTSTQADKVVKEYIYSRSK